MPARSLLTFLPLVLVIISQAAAEESPSYRVLAQDNGRVALVEPDGKVSWEVPCKYNSHDIHLLDNGNFLLHTGPATVVEMAPDKSIVWQYTARPKQGYQGGVEIHAFQRLADGNTMVAESGNRRIVEVNQEGKAVKTVALKVDRPHPHRDTGW